MGVWTALLQFNHLCVYSILLENTFRSWTAPEFIYGFYGRYWDGALPLRGLFIQGWDLRSCSAKVPFELFAL